MSLLRRSAVERTGEVAREASVKKSTPGGVGAKKRVSVWFVHSTPSMGGRVVWSGYISGGEMWEWMWEAGERCSGFHSFSGCLLYTSDAADE